MGQIYLLGIFIIVAQSCSDQKRSATRVEKLIGAEKCGETDSAGRHNTGGLLKLTSNNNRLTIFTLPGKIALPEHFKPEVIFSCDRIKTVECTRL